MTYRKQTLKMQVIKNSGLSNEQWCVKHSPFDCFYTNVHSIHSRWGVTEGICCVSSKSNRYLPQDSGDSNTGSNSVERDCQ